MNILVCISSVPDTTSKINFTDNNTKFDSNGIQFVINPYDEFGLTRAMILKESTAGKVTVITVGDTTVEPVMRKALAIGADDAVRINMVPTESYSVALEISNYIKQNNFDIIIAGRESIDYNGGAVPAMIAEMTNLPFVNACIGLEIEGENAKLVREIDGGKEMISCSLPMVVGGQKGLVLEGDLRIPNMRGIMNARSKDLLVIEPISVSSSLKYEKYTLPPEKDEIKYIDKENIETLINELKLKNL